MQDLIGRWQRSWVVARALPAATEGGGGLRVHGGQTSRDVDYFALSDAAIPELAARVLREPTVTWLHVATGDPASAAEALRASGLDLLRSGEQLMAADLRTQPRAVLAEPYSLATSIARGVVSIVVRDASGEQAARGFMGVSGTDAAADKILTEPGHRRRGLAAAVMGTLAENAVRLGATQGLLVASEEGQLLYTRLGWHKVADVLIAGPPGTVYPT